MIVEFDALCAKIATTGVPAYVGEVPSETPMPYCSVQPGPGGATDERPACDRTDSQDMDVRVLVTDITARNVLTRLQRIRDVLSPGATFGPLTVTGRRVHIRWERQEMVAIDRDITPPGTNRHPAYGVDTYRLVSDPQEDP